MFAAFLLSYIMNPAVTVIAAFVLWLILLLIFSFWITRFPCPQCSLPFISNQKVSFVKKRRCNNCGLGLYEKPNRVAGGL